MPLVLPPSKSTQISDAGWEITDSGLIKKRAFWCLLALSLAFFALLSRLYFLQLVRGSSFVAQARTNRLRPVTLPAPRGLILDRNGLVLATSRSQHSVSVVPGLLPSARREKEQRARLLTTLGFLLGTSADAIEAQIADAMSKQARPYDAVPIAQDVDLETVTRIEENRPRLSGAVLVTNDLRRFYPYGAMAGHVLGYSGVVNERDLTRARAGGEALGFGDRVGKSGIERQYDGLLRGTHGAQVFEVDAQNRPLHQRESVPAQAGATLNLSLDWKLQEAAENALSKARNNGAVAAIDPRNGEVLALASRPNFDPNLFELSGARFSAAYRQMLATPGHPLLNRAVTSRFPPGSTFKMIAASAGLQKGAITPGWNVNCPGSFYLGRRFGCWKVHGAGVDLDEALEQSCDVYFYQMALRLGDPESSGPTYLAQVARQFGLGSKTKIDLPVDEAGLVPDPAWRARINAGHPDLAHWFPGNTLNMSIGQGDVLATPLQMALATGALANGGTLWQPHLLRKSTRQDGTKKAIVTPLVGHKIGIDARNLALVRDGLRKVVTEGTGRACNLPQVAVAGKTGSAEDANNALPHSWWICFAPYDKPTIAIAVMVENSGHGSENALPIARDILQARFPDPAATPTATPPIAPQGA